MGYLLVNRLNKIEELQKASRTAKAHFFAGEEYKEIEPQLEKWKGGASFVVKYTSREHDFVTREPPGTEKKVRMDKNDVLVIDDLDELES